MANKLKLIIAAVILILIGLSSSLYTVDQRQYVIVRQFGEIVAVKKTPGLYFKIPLLQDVKFFDSRIITLDLVDAERFLTSEKQNVLVDSYVKWRVFEPRQYYISVGGDESRAQIRLWQTINSILREEFGKRTMHDVISGERDKIMDILREKANQDAKEIGIEILDVRLKRVDLPKEVSAPVYQRMEAERKRVANEWRSTGSAEAEKIRADAEKQRDIIVAQAYREAQRIKGEGDAKASAIYASAYNQNPEFYAFYRSLEAYRQSFKSKSDVLLLEPNSEFFKYLKNAGGKTSK
jgi:membrane protease subunit HflC